MKKCLKSCIMLLLVFAFVACLTPNVAKAAGEMYTYCDRCNKVTKWDYYSGNYNENVSAYCSNCKKNVAVFQIVFFEEWDCQCGNMRYIRTILEKECPYCGKNLL